MKGDLWLIAIKRQTTRLNKLKRKRCLSAEEREELEALETATKEIFRSYKRRVQRHDKAF